MTPGRGWPRPLERAANDRPVDEVAGEHAGNSHRAPAAPAGRPCPRIAVNVERESRELAIHASPPLHSGSSKPPARAPLRPRR